MKAFFTLCGALAAVTFVAMFVLFGALTPGYSHLTQAVSEFGMSDAPYALLWNLLGFGLVGVLIVAFAWGLYLEFGTKRGGLLIAGLVAISGLGFAGLGVFPAAIDFQPSLQTTLHSVMVMTSYFTFIAASFVFAIALRSDPYWKPWGYFSAAMGIIGLLSFAIPPSVPLGVSQRLGLGANFLWLLVLSYLLYRKANLSRPLAQARSGRGDEASPGS